MYFSLKNLAIGAKYNEYAILAGLGRNRAGDIIINVRANMKIILTIFFGVCFVIIFVSLKIQSRRKREKIRQANLDVHMQMLNKGIERISQNNSDLVSGLEVHPPLKSMRDLWGFPPSQNTVIEEIRVADDVHSDWDYIVHIHEGAEQYLGTFHFLSLEERFNKIQGIEACKHEDREIFLIRTKKIPIDYLQVTIWQEFLATAEESYDNNNGL